jgi:hypothetical protein
MRRHSIQPYIREDDGGQDANYKDGRHGAKGIIPACGGLLTRDEQKVICMIVGRAFKYMMGEGTLPQGTKLDAWRKEEQAKIGIPSLRTAQHTQYRTIVAHFEGMMPATSARAFQRHMEPTYQPQQKVALHKIHEICQAANLPWPAYPLSIAAKQFKVKTLDELTPKAAWALFYTMNPNASKGRARKHVKAVEQAKAKEPQIEIREGAECPF